MMSVKSKNLWVCSCIAIGLCMVISGSSYADLTASFTANPNPVPVGYSVTYDASSSSGDAGETIIEWEWDLDNDGAYDDASGELITHAYSSEGTYFNSLRIADDAGATATTGESITVFINHDPVADADGPYVINVGDDLTLDGSGSYDIDGLYGDCIVLWEWDLHNDGIYDVVGETVSLLWTDIAPLGSDSSIGLRVTDMWGETDVNYTTLTVVPIPSAFLLGMLGLTVAGVKLRKHA